MCVSSAGARTEHQLLSTKLQDDKLVLGKCGVLCIALLIISVSGN